MALVKWNPMNELANWEREVDRMIRDVFSPEVRLFEDISHVVPLIDMEETDDAFNITAELPGMKKEDIKITFQDNILTISGEKKTEEKREEKNFHRMERSFGKFSRSIGIPAGVVLDKIDAEYKNGVLYIHIPKAEEAKTKKIDIKLK
ncbi:MAG TPA: Hsp20/alpha crystallin family protein [Caldithrix abyssi]|uniref:Hsp20/alpha crystallin family protein n=1 Tax=Caldithrix abyssi TaxID=187145 RepID=A0A7V5PR14_CALAY|nr:Hsp20/alpha crystallin family protein [Caldithrix abyssi]